MNTNQFLAGLILFLSGLIFTVEGQLLRILGDETTGVVVPNKDVVNDGALASRLNEHKTTLRYTAQGKTYTHESRHLRRSRQLYGARHVILYRPSDPSHARLEHEVKGFGIRGFGGVLIMVSGVMLGGRAILLYFANRPQEGVKKTRDTTLY